MRRFSAQLIIELFPANSISVKKQYDIWQEQAVNQGCNIKKSLNMNEIQVVSRSPEEYS